jgi:hypothetical protein
MPKKDEGEGDKPDKPDKGDKAPGDKPADAGDKGG